MDYLVNRAVLDFFRGKRVLITGDTGFKGSWLSLWLKELGAEIVGYALPPAADGVFSQLGLAELIHHVDGDIRDLSSLNRVFSGFKPEILFHLAAQALVRRSYRDPKETFETNIIGSVNILELCRRSDFLKALIYVTSDKCYRNQEWIWGYRENDELGGVDPYSASKAAAEVVFSSYLQSFFADRPAFGAASVRAGNVIGGGDWAEDRIVPDVIRSLQQNQPITVRNPKAVRPWQHVLEPLSGYLKLAAQLVEDPKKYSGSWNFGPDPASCRTVDDLVQQIIRHWGYSQPIIEPETSTLHEATMLRLNCDKANTILRWEPRWNFEKAVSECVSWYKQVFEGEPAITVTTNQIKAYIDSGGDQIG